MRLRDLDNVVYDTDKLSIHEFLVFRLVKQGTEVSMLKKHRQGRLKRRRRNGTYTFRGWYTTARVCDMKSLARLNIQVGTWRWWRTRNRALRSVSRSQRRSRRNLNSCRWGCHNGTVARTNLPSTLNFWLRSRFRLNCLLFVVVV